MPMLKFEFPIEWKLLWKLVNGYSSPLRSRRPQKFEKLESCDNISGNRVVRLGFAIESLVTINLVTVDWSHGTLVTE